MPQTLERARPQRLERALLSPREEIDRVRWYHEFDFGGGLAARSATPDIEAHRRIWGFIERQLEAIDFRGKSVLDIGCWDGKWSFYAETRGAREVWATDDLTQSWSDGKGLLLAKRLLDSRVHVRQDVSVYELTDLGRKFDIILCLGVYYHLLDPFYALAQLRHCCHRDSLLLLEGDLARLFTRQGEARYCIGRPERPVFVPSAETLNSLVEAAYFRVQSQTCLHKPSPWYKRLGHRLLGRLPLDRAFTVCRAWEGHNRLHPYKPPFGLAAYDQRYRGGA
jgi:tRNA (mo5U34)-methyltransferase